MEVTRHKGLMNEIVYRCARAGACHPKKNRPVFQFQLSKVDEWVLAGGADDAPKSEGEQK
ncbi:hypothetical protein [Geoalkalibacter sp.]|uniref:hypothetical protein n=1 Tax=Geoalkalibacter sp. TaxID=3041440 RepID=UPI00272E5639|nr:hypothetical protein [Geoalkalibacter sp.]